MILVNKKKSLIISCIILIVFVVFLSYHIWHKQDTKEFKYPKLRISSLPQKVQDSLQHLEEKIEQEKNFLLHYDHLFSREVITSSTDLILKIVSSDNNNDYKLYIVSMPESFVGLTARQLEAKLDQWELEKFKPNKSLVLSRVFNGDFAQKKEYPYYLGLYDNRVAIYKKNDNNDSKEGKNNESLVQKTELHVSQLPREEKDFLQKGIYVESEEELLTILEGLLSYKLEEE